VEINSEKQLKIELVNILDKVDQICRENNLTYFLVGGTLLGAKRHNGFIPWDDDLDIAMPRDDYNKFINICNNNDLGKLYFRHYGSDHSYYLSYGKVCKKNTKYITSIDQNVKNNMEIFIDVFPLDFANDKASLIQTIQANIVKAIKSVLIRRAGIDVPDSFRTDMARHIFGCISDERLKKWQILAMTCFDKESRRYVINLGSNYSYKKQTMKYDVYFPAKSILFEGKYYSAPNNTEVYLENIYGTNYMELPPESKRITHSIVCLEIGE